MAEPVGDDWIAALPVDLRPGQRGGRAIVGPPDFSRLITNPYSVGVSGRYCNSTDHTVGRRLDARPSGPVRRRVGRFCIIGAPERFSSCQNAIGFVRIEYEGGDEQSSLIEGVRNSKWHRLPVPAPHRAIPELPADIAVTRGVIRRRTVGATVNV